jgi:hypothetical protein
MKASALQKVSEKVCKKYPKLSGKRPKVMEQSPGRYLLIYAFTDELPGGKSIQQQVRVVADEEGNINKMSVSRG